MIALWALCFPGDADFQTYFFDHIYQPQYNLLLFQGDTLCAMTQMLPYRMQNGHRTEDVTYIYGACTHPDFRRQHLMDRLLRRSFALDQQLGRAASVLIPQEAWLFDFYAQFGYVPCLSASHQTFTAEADITPCAIRPAAPADLSEMDGLFHTQLWEGSYLCRNRAEWEKQYEMFCACGGEVLCAEREGMLAGYALVWNTADDLWAQEFVTLPDMQAPFAAAILERCGKAVCKATGLQFETRKPLGCVLRHDGTQPAEGYINLMLN